MPNFFFFFIKYLYWKSQKFQKKLDLLIKFTSYSLYLRINFYIIYLFEFSLSEKAVFSTFNDFFVIFKLRSIIVFFKLLKNGAFTRTSNPSWSQWFFKETKWSIQKTYYLDFNDIMCNFFDFIINNIHIFCP